MTRTRRHVLIAGGGVAGLETLLALRALAGDRLDITILAPELKFVNRSMSAQQPFKVQRGRGFRLEDTAAELGADWHRGALDRVVHAQHRVVTRDRDSLSYDMLVLALGARPQREWHAEGVLTYRGGRDGPHYRMLLHQLREGRIEKVAFVKPAGASWPLPLYDLALMTAAECAAHDRADVELSLITPEEEPLAIFGTRASAAISTILSESGVTLHTCSYGRPGSPGQLDISPGHRCLVVDRIVTEPRLVGPSLRGIPSKHEGFIYTDAHGRVPGVDDVFAAGDATTFPVKQGGLAAQQADAVAEAIAAAAGAQIDPQPFRPVLRGTLLTGGATRYLRADISGGAGDDSTVSDDALWWPPNKLSGRYLAPYLSSKTGEAADVMPQDQGAIEVDTPAPRPRKDMNHALLFLLRAGDRAARGRALSQLQRRALPRPPARDRSSLRDEAHARQLSPRHVDRDRASAPCRPVEPAMSAPEAPVRRLLFVADAAVAEVHDLPPEARALLSAAVEVYVLTPTLPGRLAWLADDVDQFRHLADQRLDGVLGHMRSVGAHASGAHNRGSVLTVIADAVGDFKPDHMLLALRSAEHANWQERGLEERLQKRFGLPLISYAVDSRGHATGAQRP